MGLTPEEKGVEEKKEIDFKQLYMHLVTLADDAVDLQNDLLDAAWHAKRGNPEKLKGFFFSAMNHASKLEVEVAKLKKEFNV